MSQRRYKSDFGKRVGPLLHAKPGDWVYISRENATRSSPGDQTQYNKLQPKAIGPYEVVASDKHTVIVLREDQFFEMITLDRTEKTSAQVMASESLDKSHGESDLPYERDRSIYIFKQRAGTAVRTPPTAEEYVEWYLVDKVVKYVPKEDLSRIGWAGDRPEDDTQEPPSHLRWNTIAAYFKSTNEPIPRHLIQFRPSKKLVKHIYAPQGFK